MEWKEARVVGDEVVEVLAGACERIEIAGSIRRGKARVKDVEIVLIPRLGRRQVGLWEYEEYALTDGVLEGMVAAGVLAWDEVVKRRGPKYKRLVHLESGMVVEVFGAVEENWGLILAIRTGPAEFNKRLVAKEWHGGAMPLEMRMDGGFLWLRGERVVTETEEGFFEALGVPCWEPGERSGERLRAFLVRRPVDVRRVFGEERLAGGVVVRRGDKR